MGNNPSKPTEHVFYGETPVQFSHNLVNALETSTESDSTRSKLADLHVQQLVAEELKRLQQREDQVLQQVSSLPPDDSASLIRPAGAEAEDPLALSRHSLQAKIDQIRERFQKQVGAEAGSVGVEDEEVRRAREDVVRCLRGNDRRPLECSEEVQRFRKVAESKGRKWVGDVVGR
ncbi:hypothetical protein BDZ91DRAFT_718950 [Kalaharituber pfeilii]|nr:hypothetical protein BDZ91DRAFT_718950 [Kalaharituber pfeilii]